MPTGDRPSPPSRVCKIVYTGHYGATRWNNVMWIKLLGQGSLEHSWLVGIADGMNTLYGNHLMPLQNTNSTLESTQLVFYDPPNDAIEAIVSSGVAGTHAGQHLPANVACCISWDIAPHYRGGHPRTYLAGQVLDATDTVASWTGAHLVAVSDAANAFHTAVESLQNPSQNITAVEHGIVSFVRAKEWRQPPVFYRISAATVDSRVDTQRRRLGRDR